MVNNRLNYLKTQFLNNTEFNFLQRQDITLGKEAIEHYSMSLIEYIDHIKNAQSEEEFLSYAQNLKKEFLQTYSEMLDSNSSSLESFRQYYIKSYFNDLESWYQNECQNYEHKSKFHFFNLFKSKQDIFPERIFDNLEVVEKSYDILNKYQLKSINLSGIHHNKDAMLSLKQLDTSLREACSKLGIHPEAFGLKSTLSINIVSNTNPSYSPLKKEINIPKEDIGSQYLTHEWTHALDNYIGFETTAKTTTFATENEQLIEHYNVAIQKAHDTMKMLTRRLFNQHSEAIEKDRQTQMQLSIDKFLSLAIGDKWYGLSDNQKASLKNEEMFNAINNYMISVKKEGLNFDMYDYTYDITHQIAKSGIMSESDILDNLKKQVQNIYSDVLPTYEKMNQNMLGNPSLYYKLSKMGSWVTYTLRVYHNLNEKMHKKSEHEENLELNSRGNTLNKNYFIQPTEMLARYFESQLYPNATRLENLYMLSGVYKMTHDAEFENIKNNLIVQALGPEALVDSKLNLKAKIEQHREKMAIPSPQVINQNQLKSL